MKYIISDIHGMLDKLSSLIDKIEAKDANASYIFTGDYCDRGPDSKGVIEFLINLSHQRECVFCVGNHDAIFYYLLTGENLFGNITDMISGDSQNWMSIQYWWAQNGYTQTLESYGVETNINAMTLQWLRNIVPQAHKDFLKSLTLFYADDTIHCQHSWGNPLKELPDKNTSKDTSVQMEVLWERLSGSDINAENFDPVWGKKTLIVGHTPTYYYNQRLQPMEPVVRKGLILMDCGSFIPQIGRIAAYCVETKEFLFSN